MPDILDKMDPTKKLNLINAALEEFGANRFEKASTNAIVKKAGISKGLLYHYFKTKDELFDYLIDFSMNAVAVPIAEKIGLKERDIIKRIEKIALLKLEIMAEYPGLASFSKVMYAGMDYEQIKEQVMKYNPIPIDMYYSHNVDETFFRDNIDVSMAVMTIQSTLEKIADGYLAKINMGIDEDLDAIITIFNQYLKHFRVTYYKEEFQ